MKNKPHPGGARRQQPIYTAQYRDHPIAKYNASPLIRALPVLPDSLTLQQRLTRLPAREEHEREEDSSVRILRLAEVFNIYICLPRVSQLLQSLNTLICEGYMGRIPYSSADMALRQQTYEMQQRGECFDIDDEENGAEFTAALMGIPGIGKSRALRRITKWYRRVIYHPELDIYQIPALLIEMPYNGVSINTLAHAIIRKLDQMFPEGKYYEAYLAGREVAEVRFMDAVQLMQTHYVGILLVDESQNKDYRSKDSRKPSKGVAGQTPLTTLLITATNQSEIPMLMTGTNELSDLLGKRASMLRRTVGRGFRNWGPLTLPMTNGAGEVVDLGEFDVFLQLVWDYQWTKTPFERTQRMRNIFHYYTLGISDIVIKLFHDIQLRAINNGGDEVVDEALVHDVATKELGALTKLTAALRRGDDHALAGVADLAAYRNIDPEAFDFDRDELYRGLFTEGEDAAAEPQDEDNDLVDAQAEAAAVEEPRSVAPGRKASGRKRKTSQAAAGPFTPAPELKAVDDLDAALGD